MNNEEQNKNQTEQNSEKKETAFFKRAKHNMNAVWLVCAIIFLSLYAIVNISSITGIFSAILSVLTPILLGAAIAYLLNPILKIFEKCVFKKLKNKKTIRALSLLSTYIVAVLALISFALIFTVWRSSRSTFAPR